MSVGKVGGGYQNAYAQWAQNAANAGEETVSSAAVAQNTRNRDVVAFSAAGQDDGRLEKWKEMLKKLDESKNQFQIKQNPPKDNSAILTQRLVAAGAQSQVRSIISDAVKSISAVRRAIASGEQKDRAKYEAILRKLNKLVDRAGQKLRNLDDEDVVQGKEKKAKEAKQEKRARELRDELMQRKMARQARERRWLKEALEDGVIDVSPPSVEMNLQQDPAIEAEVAAEADAVAATEVAMEMGGAEMGEAAVAADAPAGDAGGGEVAVE